jgi:hypothetical protein
MEIQRTTTPLGHLQDQSRSSTSKRVDLTPNQSPSHSPVTKHPQHHLMTHHQNLHPHPTPKRNPTPSLVTLNQVPKHLQSEWPRDYGLISTQVEINRTRIQEGRGARGQVPQEPGKQGIRENEPSDIKKTVTMNMVIVVCRHRTGLESGLGSWYPRITVTLRSPTGIQR